MSKAAKDLIHAGILFDMKQAVHEAVANMKDDWFCGFAYVNIDGTSPLAKYLKKHDLGHKGYPRGFDISVYPFLKGTKHDHTQSMYVKEEAGRAIVRVLAKYGIVGSMHSRPD